MSYSPDHKFYEDKEVTVTKTRVVIGGKTYSMANITSVAPYSKSNTGCGCVCIGLGTLGLIGTTGAMNGSSASGILFFIAFTLICFVISAYFLKPSYSVEIRSSSAEERVLNTDKTRVFAIVEAINQAMEARG